VITMKWEDDTKYDDDERNDDEKDDVEVVEAITDKAAARDAWVEGWKRGKHVEEVDDITIGLAEDRFERWWSKNYEQSGGGE